MRQLVHAAATRARYYIKGASQAACPRGRERRRPYVESLESRRLLTTITEYSVPLVNHQNTQPSQIAVGPNNTLYFVEPGANAIGSVSTASPDPATIANLTLPSGANPDGITLGPDLNIWFTETFSNQIGVDKLTGATPPALTGITSNSGPAGITSANGYLWFTQIFTNQIGRLDPKTGVVTEFNLPTGSTFGGLDSKIVLGPDSNLWFTEFGAIAAFDPANPNAGANLNITKTATLAGGSNEKPFGITAGPNGTIWYTAQTQNAGPPVSTTFVVGAFSTGSPSSIHETQVTSAAEPFGITAGPDGNMWFAVTGTATVAGTIDAINPSTFKITTLKIPTNVVAIPSPIGIVAAPDGNLWFTDGSGAIGVVADTKLVVTAQPQDVSTNSPFGLTVTDEYASGVTDTAFNGSVTIKIGNNPSGGTLTGTQTVTAVNGVATFSGLMLNNPGNPYTLVGVERTVTAPPTSITTNGINVTSTPQNTLPLPPLSLRLRLLLPRLLRHPSLRQFRRSSARAS